MSGDRARSALEGTRFTDLRWAAATGSTNDDAMVAARAGEADGLVLVADHQHAGRGRLGRTWQAPPGASLLCSVLLRPPVSVEQAHVVVHAVALAAQHACRTVAGVALDLKWPNDLLEPGGPRKVGGILAESIVEGDHLEALVVGFGLNVRWPAALPDDLAAIATALNHLGAPLDVDREVLLSTLLLELEGWCVALTSGDGRARLRAAYEAACTTVGEVVRVQLTAGGEIVGRAQRVEPDGSLVVRDDAGIDHVVTAADVVHLRRAPPS